jgi:hypothetical protein
MIETQLPFAAGFVTIESLLVSIVAPGLLAMGYSVVAPMCTLCRFAD